MMCVKNILVVINKLISTGYSLSQPAGQSFTIKNIFTLGKTTTVHLVYIFVLDVCGHVCNAWL